jgi:hypothetical protein
MEEKKAPEQLIQDFESEFVKARNFWNSVIQKMTTHIQDELSKSLILECEAISRRQEITEEIAASSFSLYQEHAKIKVLNKEKMEYYLTKYQIKINAGQTKMMIEADLAWVEMKANILDNHIQFLLESRKTIDHLIWSVKNKIQLYNITGIEG